MSGSYRPSMAAQQDVLVAIRAVAEAGQSMPKPHGLAVDLGRSLSVIHASIAALHDRGVLTMRRRGMRLVINFPDGVHTA